MKNNNLCIFISLIIFLILFALTLPLFLAHEFNTDTSLTFLNLLSYYGSILGAGATIGAVVLAINHNRKLFEEEQILSTKPFLETKFKSLPKDVSPIENTIDKLFYLTYSMKSKHISLSNLSLFPVQNFYPDPVIIEYTLSNVGAGNALNLKIVINEVVVSSNFVVPVNKQIIFYILFDFIEKRNVNEIIDITFFYSDVHSKMIYEQIDKFVILPSGKCHQSNLISSPKQLPQMSIEELIKYKPVNDNFK